MANKDNSYHLILTSFEDEYDETHDPVWVWHAIEFCSSWHRKTGEQIHYPQWVLDYLSVIAEMMLKLDDTMEDLSAKIAEIIGIRKNSISSSIQSIRDKVLFFEIQALINQGKKSDEAIDSIARAFSLSTDSVANVYQRFKR